MDLLLEVKHLFDKLVEAKIVETKPEYQQIEDIAEKCYNENYEDIEKFLLATLSNENYTEIKSCIDKIKEIIKNEKESN